ncbi:hypothetical protein L6R44_10885 [Enterobacter cloacae complex sp. ECC445]|uniref:hypothetical protein n=1 Tax=Enterobacter cloacae complex sp. ECC445 TaxID=2913213 RepID=UPI001F397C15|nr:hypothetical protein [Enterobacter cloacae complex sp. ECC445]MCG0456610.1 hypothetical protein [Enterobacter cloacae complex sp. ECC445]
MRIKLKSTSSSDKQLDFFALFNLNDEEEESHIDITGKPLGYDNNPEFVNGNVRNIYDLPTDAITPSGSDSDQQNRKIKNLPVDAIIYSIIRATENDYLFRMPEYDAELGAAVFNWNTESVVAIYVAAMEESFENLRFMIKNKNLFNVEDDGSLVVNPMLIVETQWYMSEVFEMACAVNGIDPIEFRHQLRDFLYSETHAYKEMKLKSELYKSDPTMVFHDCSDGTDWETFFDGDYFYSSKKLALKWSDSELVTLFKKSFTDAIDLFETLVVTNKLTTRDAKGWVQINPVFESELEWIKSDVFNIIGTHLGYDVESVRKQIMTTCQMAFH